MPGGGEPALEHVVERVSYTHVVPIDTPIAIQSSGVVALASAHAVAAEGRAKSAAGEAGLCVQYGSRQIRQYILLSSKIERRH